MRIASLVFCALLTKTIVVGQTVASWIRSEPSASAVAIVGEQAAPILYDADDHRVVALAASDLASDIERITSKRPDVRVDWNARPAGSAILVGTLGRSALIQALVESRKLEVAELQGAWESFVVTTVEHPLPGVSRALVIVGSDRRGTAYGIYEVSQAIGISPWHWWADVAPAPRSALHVEEGTRRFGPPSVKYRGIFINDEDWGLQPWAAKTFEPEHGGIGPKTYAKVFELLLRLKANTLWPAMHECTKPFNFFPENRRLADDYAIVMGSSHAEPMLRNNVGEWKDEKPKYNYATNREGVFAYWEQRMKENGRYENIYTLGMRGIHDSGMQGASSDAQRIKFLEQIFTDQRGLIAKYASGGAVEQVPQMFCAYKEVLGLYRQGLQVPDDVTIVWPDDNFGYIRNYTNARERGRKGGFGVYYHISYLGAPLAFLWLQSVPPALIWEEMSKAYDHGARQMWIVNVGDIKPAEIGTEFFLQMAWDIKQWDHKTQAGFLRAWAAREFGAAAADDVAAILREYFALNFQRKPEHLQWWLPRQPVRPSVLTRAEIDDRLARFARLRTQVDAVRKRIGAEKADAFFELVTYPAIGTALANERYFYGELAALENNAEQAERAKAADVELGALTKRFNDEIAGGKWRGFMNVEPADSQWSFRIKQWELPKYDPAIAAEWAARKVKGHTTNDGADDRRSLAFEAETFATQRGGAGARWEIVPGLGRTGDAVVVLPSTAPIVPLAEAAERAPVLEYACDIPAAGEYQVTFYLIPTQPIVADRGLRFALGVAEAVPREVLVHVRDGSKEWAQGVLNASITGTVSVEFANPGKQTLKIYGTDTGVVLDKIVVHRGELPPSYFGPPPRAAN